MIKAALWYLNKGFSVIPVRRDKKPLIKWEQYQKERATEEDVRGWFEKWPEAMLGVVTGAISGICVVDIDTDEGFKAISKILPDSLETPTCSTPKGGQHIYFKAPDKIMNNNARTIPGCDFRGEGGYVVAPPSMNGNGKGYVWLDGLKISDLDVAPLPDAYVSALADSSIKDPLIYKINSKKCLQAVDSMFTHGRRDEDLFHIANLLVKGGAVTAEIFQVLKNLIVSWGEKPDAEWINAKIESALKRSFKRDRALSDDVKDYVLSTTGIFLSTDIYNCLQLSTRDEKKNTSIALKRLCEKGIVEKYGNKNGCWRVVDDACEDINFMAAEETSMNLKWPFELEEQVKTMPKNIIVVAGEPNAGKTAFLLKFTEMNMDKHKINYFSSEMGAIEMKERLRKFNRPLESWNFTAKERVSNFGDVIKPNDINIIDFLEVYDEFYRMGGMIKEIFDNLDKGIAIIAIQKNKGNEFGLGGMRGLEKARLYLTMQPNKIKIVKAKNWKTFENPNNLAMEFKLVQGCEFKEQGFWQYEEYQTSK